VVARSKKTIYAVALCILVVVASLLGLAHPTRARAQQTRDPQVQVASVQSLGSGYLQVEGVMSGNVIRNDSSYGRYRVPVTLVYLEDAGRCSGEALVDVINSVFYETFGVAGTSQDPLFPSLLPAAGFSSETASCRAGAMSTRRRSGASSSSSGNAKPARSRIRR
jgi:hypothetical protein